MKVIVVGFGVLGAAVSYHLARLGATVLTIDAGSSKPKVSEATFSCLSVFGTRSESYLEFRLRAMRYLRELCGAIRADHAVRMNGTLRWSGDDRRRKLLERDAQFLLDHQVRCRRVSAGKVAALEPELRVPPDQDLFHVPDEGWLDVAPYIGRLLAGEPSGAVEVRTTVVSICEPAATCVRVRTSDGWLEADRVVLAAGTQTAALARCIGVALPVEEHPGVLAFSARTSVPLKHVIYADDVHFSADAAQRIVGALTAPHGQAPIPSQEEARNEARDVLDRASHWLPNLRGSAVAVAKVGVRPVPADGFPIAGWLPGSDRVYVLTSHSGVTLSALLGRWCAQEVAGGAPVDELKPYHPERFSICKPARQAAVAEGRPS